MKKYLTRVEASEYLSEHGFKTATKSLAKYATVGGGPDYKKFGNRVLYSPSDLIAWAESKTTHINGQSIPATVPATVPMTAEQVKFWGDAMNSRVESS